MAHNVFEISSLAKIAVAPSSWRVLQSPDKTYQLSFRYLENEEFMPVLTQATKRHPAATRKIYKTEKSLLKDIARVHSGKHINEALIRFIPA